MSATGPGAGPGPAGDAPPTSGGTAPTDDRPLGAMFLDVSERITFLVREEIELAKAEVYEKAVKLLQGSVVGIAAGVFAVLFLAMLMHAFAWLLNDLFFGDTVWLGFFVEALLWLAIAIGAGAFAYKSVKEAVPPAPTMAIEEAKEIRETLEAGS